VAESPEQLNHIPLAALKGQRASQASREVVEHRKGSRVWIGIFWPRPSRYLPGPTGVPTQFFLLDKQHRSPNSQSFKRNAFNTFAILPARTEPRKTLLQIGR
jgi:hypothetical protein